MGYNLTIGEAVIFYDADDLAIWIEAEAAQHDDAPAHDRFTGKGNSRSPSYSVWHKFCEEAGISELFYGGGWDQALQCYRPCSDDFHRETPLLAKHPGAQAICRDDLSCIRRAREKRQASNGGKPAGFWDDPDIDNGTDPVLARLLWLEFWFDWALTNCKRPIIENG